MKRLGFVLLFAIAILSLQNISFAKDDITYSESKIDSLQRYRNSPKLYLPNFVIIGQKTTLRVYAEKNTKIKLMLDYGYGIEKQSYEQISNENGVAVFTVDIVDKDDLIGKSVAIDAYIFDEKTKILIKAVPQTENAKKSSSNRVYIADKNSAKGVALSPMQALNQMMLNTYDERSGFNPATDQMYSEYTPVYIKNMRDAQDNVREFNTDFNNTDR